MIHESTWRSEKEHIEIEKEHIEMRKQRVILAGRQPGWRGYGLVIVTTGLVIYSFWPCLKVNSSRGEPAQPGQGQRVTRTSDRPWTGWREVEDRQHLFYEEISLPASQVRWTATRVSLDLPPVVEVPLLSESPGRWRGRSILGPRGVTPGTHWEVEVSGFRSATRESLLVTIHQAEMDTGGGTGRATLTRIYLGREVSEGATVP